MSRMERNTWTSVVEGLEGLDVGALRARRKLVGFGRRLGCQKIVDKNQPFDFICWIALSYWSFPTFCYCGDKVPIAAEIGTKVLEKTRENPWRVASRILHLLLVKCFESLSIVLCHFWIFVRCCSLFGLWIFARSCLGLPCSAADCLCLQGRSREIAPMWAGGIWVWYRTEWLHSPRFLHASLACWCYEDDGQSQQDGFGSGRPDRICHQPCLFQTLVRPKAESFRLLPHPQDGHALHAFWCILCQPPAKWRKTAIPDQLLGPPDVRQPWCPVFQDMVRDVSGCFGFRMFWKHRTFRLASQLVSHMDTNMYFQRLSFDSSQVNVRWTQFTLCLTHLTCAHSWFRKLIEWQKVRESRIMVREDSLNSIQLFSDLHEQLEITWGLLKAILSFRFDSKYCSSNIIHHQERAQGTTLYHR